jgi:hypothetical protein
VQASDEELVDRLAAATIATSLAAMGESATKASELEGNLATANWEIFEALAKLVDDRREEAASILGEVRAALTSDEHVLELAPALKGAQARAVRLLTKPTKAEQANRNEPPAPGPRPATGSRVIQRGEKRDLSPAAAKVFLDNLANELSDGQSARVDVNWVIEEPGGPA